ncbi:hypothetical protein B9Z19DRAFT_1124246 [Tuber borchii]|uniref:Uncharacterized protein n=1 Tax=Tuber borchii TaxID=42251 RepID=A0A2T6ZX13_TUBBO|nr:hypothetical protein B9Z19DRAFT_1124246 [Tuber borchii]
MAVREDELDEKRRLLIDWVKAVEWHFIDLYESAEEDGNCSENSDGIYGEEMIYEEEEEEGEEETVHDGDDDNNDNYHADRERELSSDSLSQSENSDVDKIGAGETSGSNLLSASWDLDRSHSASSTQGLYGDVAVNRFQASTQDGERLLGWAMTPKDFIISPEDQQDSIEYVIT